MKIGIVTQPLGGNYGGILQNYALQEVLRSLGHEPITLDFQDGFSGLTWLLMSLRRRIAVLRGRYLFSNNLSIPYAQLIQKNNETIDFIKNNIECTTPFWNRYSSKLIQEYKIDAVITGSDQVWRPCYNSRLTDMFLGFVKQRNVKKIAYAASFGTADWEYSPELAKRCSRLIKRLNAVSVRESSGINLVNRLGSAAIQVLDPTLLLGRIGFEKLLTSTSNNQIQTNLTSYMLDLAPETESILSQIAKIAGCSNVHIFSAEEYGMGPIEWLYAIRDSKFMVTDSFHGTAFCLLFHVPFISVINTGRGADRFYSLLQPLGLEDRLVPNIADAVTKVATHSPIDWSEVDARLSELRSYSQDFLITSLQ